MVSTAEMNNSKTVAVATNTKKKEDNMSKSNTHKMAGTPASNGQLLIPTTATKQKVKTRKPRMKDPCALNNIGQAIYNPLSGRFIGSKHYYKIKNDTGIDLSQLKRNSWITSFKGTMTVDEFLAQEIVQEMLRKNEYYASLDVDDTGKPIDAQAKSWEEDVMAELDVAHSSFEDELEDELVARAGVPSPDTVDIVHGITSDKVNYENVPDLPHSQDDWLDSEKFLLSAYTRITIENQKLHQEMKFLKDARKKDLELLEKVYFTGNRSIRDLEKVLGRLGNEIGINDDTIPF